MMIPISNFPKYPISLKEIKISLELLKPNTDMEAAQIYKANGDLGNMLPIIISRFLCGNVLITETFPCKSDPKFAPEI